MTTFFGESISAITGRVHALIHRAQAEGTPSSMPQPADLYDAIGAALDLSVKAGGLIAVLADRSRLLAKEPDLYTTKRGDEPQQLLAQAERALRTASRPELGQLDAAHELISSIGRKD